MATRAQKIRLAVFFIVVNSVLAAFLVFVVGAHLLKKRDFYQIEFAGISVGGLNNGAQVKYQGITIGRVEDTYISPTDIGTVVVEISVDPTKVSGAIRRDTHAVIYNLGITGLKYIELTPGTNQADVLPPGSRIESSETFLSDLDKQAEMLTNKVELLLDRVTLLLDEQNRQHLSQTLSAASQFASGANDIVERNRPHIDATFENMALVSLSLARSTASLQATMDTLHQILISSQTQSTLADLRATARDLHKTVEGPLPQLISSITQMTENLDRTVLHVDQAVLQSRNNLLNSMQDLEEALQNIRELSEVVRENPSILIRGGNRIDE